MTYFRLDVEHMGPGAHTLLSPLFSFPLWDLILTQNDRFQFSAILPEFLRRGKIHLPDKAQPECNLSYTRDLQGCSSLPPSVLPTFQIFQKHFSLRKTTKCPLRLKQLGFFFAICLLCVYPLPFFLTK